MTELIVVFFLGPLYFFPQLLSIGSATPIDLTIFLASGLGTVFWATVLSGIGGVVRGL